jgi:hypothetical protein
MLPQLTFVAALIVAFAFASRWVSQEVARVEAQIGRLQRLLRRRVGREPGMPYRQMQLHLDEATGIYLPIDR